MNFVRNCPECKTKLKYVKKQSFKVAMKRNSKCRSCSKKGSKNPMYGKMTGDKNPMYGKIGSENPFYGKKHSKETIEKLRKSATERSKNLSKEHLRKITKILRENANTLHPYKIWLKKYGKEEADKRESLRCKRLSKAMSGKGNPMYGKPAPLKSGNGWGGWYNDWYFRSLLELSYMVNYIEKNNLKWESAEKKKFKIPYIDFKGSDRNYFPDFFVEDKFLIECKPKSLFLSKINESKKIAAEQFCRDNGFVYQMIEPKKLDFHTINTMVENGQIIFNKNTVIKFRQYKKNH